MELFKIALWTVGMLMSMIAIHFFIIPKLRFIWVLFKVRRTIKKMAKKLNDVVDQINKMLKL